MLTHTRKIEIEWGDCDPAGIVYNPRFFAMFDWSTWLLFEHALGVGKQKMLEAYGFSGFPLVDAGAKFFIPSKFGDVVDIELTIAQFGRSSFKVQHRMVKEGNVAIEAFETRVWVGRDPENADKIKSRPIPAEVIARFERG